MQRFVITMLLTVMFFTVSIFALDTHLYDISTSYTVGKAPIKILKLGGSEKIHIFCAGEDLDYNDIIDEQDEAPSWWILDNKDSQPRKVMDFDVFFKYRPFRPSLDPATNIFYIPMVGKIISIDLNGEDMEDDQVAEIDAESVGFAGGHLLITVSPGANQVGRLDVFNVETGKILQSVDGGKNIKDCIYYVSPEGISIAILNEGDFGTDNGSVMYGAINHTFDFVLAGQIEVGSGANHIIHNKGKLYVASNMSHDIHVIDPTTNAVSIWHTGTTGFGGPREMVVRGERLFVTTYSGDVREFDINTGLLNNIYDNYEYEKVENLAFINDESFYTANPYNEYYTAVEEIILWEKEENPTYKMLREVTVGKAPVGLINDEELLHVFCIGDASSNEQPSWWTIEKQGTQFQSQKRFEFEHGDIKLPFRPAVNPQTRTLFIAGNQVIKSFNIDTYTLDDDMVATFDAVALDMAGSHLMAAVRYPDRADSIVVINLQTGSVLQKVYAGNHVQDLKYYPLFTAGSQKPVISLAILTDDNDEDNNSKLLYGPISHMLDFTLENEVEVGQGGVGIYTGLGNILGVASHYSGNVYAVNAETHEIGEIKLGTPESFGPTSISSVDGLFIMVGNMAGDLRPVNVESDEENGGMLLSLGQFLPIGVPITSTVFEIDMEEDKVFMATTGPVKIGSELFENTVYIISDETMSVREYKNGDIASVKLYPNPANQFITVETELRENFAGTITMEIFSLTGAKVASINVPASVNFSHTFNISELGLAGGQYILHIKNGSEIKAVPFNIVK